MNRHLGSKSGEFGSRPEKAMVIIVFRVSSKGAAINNKGKTTFRANQKSPM